VTSIGRQRHIRQISLPMLTAVATSFIAKLEAAFAMTPD
jgi:hypothetical protein